MFWRPPTVSLANLQHRVTQCRKPFTPAGESACHADPSYGRFFSPNVGNMSANTCNNFLSVPNRKIGILQLVNRLRLGFCVACLGAVDITKMSIQYSPRAFLSRDMCIPGSSNVRLGPVNPQCCPRYQICSVTMCDMFLQVSAKRLSG